MAGDDYDDDSELGHAHGNVKIYQNGSTRLVWAWAAFATLIVVTVVGVLWTQDHNQQAETDRQLSQRMDATEQRQAQLRERVSRMEVEIENLKRR